MPTHTVRPGECLSFVADLHGFFWETLWNDPNNSGLRELREDPNTLVPGDVVYIPELRERAETRNTGALHRFRKRGIPAQIRLQLFDGEELRVNQEYEFIIDEEHRHAGRTDGEGVLKVPIAPTARRGHLIVGPDKEEYVFDFGHLPPADTTAGVKSRLQNLGFYDGEVDEELDDATREAVRAFQSRFELEPTGELDTVTLDRLEQTHDGVADFPPAPESETSQEAVETVSEDDDEF